MHYVNWLQEQEPGMTRVSARQKVYREMRRLGAAENKPGRRPSPSTQELRAKLARDHAKGSLHSPSKYVKWLRKRHKEISQQAAQQVVYREMGKLKPSE